MNSSKFIQQIMIYNDHKKYTTALITLNEASISEHINKAGVNKEELLKLLKEDLLSFSKQLEFKGKFPMKWIPTHFQVIDEPFSEENKMINSTLKMVRHRITETYQNRLDLMYGKDNQQVSAKENDKVLSRYF